MPEPTRKSTFEVITEEELALFEAKNTDYAGGAEGEKIDEWGNFNRVSTILGLYPGLKLGDPRVVALTYLMKQLDAVFWQLSRGFEGAVEGLDERLGDVHVYAKIARAINRERKEERLGG